MAATIDERVAELERANAQLRRQLDACSAELKETREQQTATAEVLQVINSSPGDLAPVFDAMLEKALRLCDAALGVLFIRDGELLRAAAALGLPASLEDFLRNPFKPDQMPLIAGVIRQGQVLQVHDAADTVGYHQRLSSRVVAVELGGVRTVLYVPLTKDGRVLGVFVIFRQEVRPFSDKQIALVQNFAAQAVIAMENARMITETREALEQQTATAEVLQVINSSPGDLAPVFDAVLARSIRLCEASFGVLWTYDGERFHAAALRNVPTPYAEFLTRAPYLPEPEGAHGRLVNGESLIHIVNVADTELYRSGGPLRRALVDLGGARSAVAVALRKDDALLGMVVVYRQEVRPFSDKQIALLQNFAAQAVIAMENARLLTETREALAQQTATAEVLQVINSSPGDLAPVFDAILEKAHSLCGVAKGSLELYDGQNFRAVATRGLADSFADELRQGYPASDNPATRPLIEGQAFTHIVDRAQHKFPFTRRAVDAEGAHTLLCLPLRRDDKLLGMIAAARQEVRAFSDEQIALLQNFAAQAVIAMENARLITETREALEQQTATAEVLQVINSSPGDLAPVFDAIVEKAHSLCDAAYGSLQLWDGENFRGVAMRGFSDAMVETLRRGYTPGPNHPCRALLDGKHIAHCADMAAVDDPVTREGAKLSGIRTVLYVALRKDNALLGQIVAGRHEVRPFTEKEIALVENFAAQAVIAMENARLLTETREALEQQTATAEVLQVINGSPGDLAPVFDAMLEKAIRLCDGIQGVLWTIDGEKGGVAAARGVSAEFVAMLNASGAAGTNPMLQRVICGERLIQIPDAAELELYRSGHPLARAATASGVRTLIWVALVREGAPAGAFAIARREVRPFTDKQIVLLQNFAAQAVIAMENARLITETREALEQQTATAEVLGVINSSPGDLAPVFDAILEKAHSLCDVAHGSLQLYDGVSLRAVATHGVSDAFAHILRHGYRAADSPASLGLIEGRRFVQIADCAEIDHPVFQSAAELAGIRTVLFVPLHRDNALLGLISSARREVRLFSDKEIALLQNFAAQAVIAMENARLLTETREALEQQTATAEVLQVINSSPGDLAPVFDAMLEKAMRLCEAAFGMFWTYDGVRFEGAALRGVPAAFAEFLREPLRAFHRETGLGRMLRGERVTIHVDMAAEEAYRAGDPLRRAIVDLGGAHSAATVALRKDDTLLGAFTVFRQEVRPFTEKQIALLQNFAAQAVIAMENARLLTETREALEQQTATAEVLQVINSSPGDLAPVFGAMLDKAANLCAAEAGVLFTYEHEHFQVAAWHGELTPLRDFLTREPLRPSPNTGLGSMARERRLIHIADVASRDSYKQRDPLSVASVELGGIRTFMAVPLVKEGSLRGAFALYRQQVQPFSEKQIALLQNFAAQAVIAMENARLLTETREALEQQTATAEVLRVINSSPGDLAPVFGAILEKAHTLCGAAHGALMAYDGEHFRAVAMQGMPEKFAELLRQPFRPSPGGPQERLLRGERLIHIPDAAVREQTTPIARAAVEAGERTVLFVPLRKDDALLGYITAHRKEVRPFADKEIALIENFAAQAVIAMENARLITELRERTHDLQESLDYQTATGDVLKVISQSTFDLEPVLQTVLDTAMRLCGNSQGEIFRLEDGEYRMAVGYGMESEYHDIEARLAIAPGPDTLVGRTVLAGRPVQIVDALADPDYQPKDDARIGKLRSMLGVPLLREGVPIGVICTARPTVEPFTEKQIALVTTFADQAVIAIENARLLNELRARTAELGRSVEELKMLSEVGRAVSSTLDLSAVLSTILTASLGMTWATAGAIFRYIRAERAFRLVEAVGWDEALLGSVGDLSIDETETAMSEAALRRTPIQLTDLAERPSTPLRDASLAAGLRSVLIVPLVGPERIFGALVLQRREAGEFPAETVRLMQTLASQSVLAIQNARLFREIADKSEQLALASQHKSQFLANMSHELRTPLNAILGYAELLVDGIYGVLPEKAQGVLERVQNNGKHLLALINDVLDLAKIEAGQLALTLEDYALAEVVRSVVTATEPLAAAKGLKFTAIVQDGMPMAHGDARRVSQVLLNLAGNAIKFTDQGEVEINASAANGQFLLTVRDTGPGIADADQERIFGEFQQIDNSDTRKKGGTGLGLAISKRMVEMQGGLISVDSVLGAGSTFRVVLPVHVEPALEEAA